MTGDFKNRNRIELKKLTQSLEGTISQKFYVDGIEQSIYGTSIVYLGTSPKHSSKESGWLESSNFRADGSEQTSPQFSCGHAESKGEQGSGTERKHVYFFLSNLKIR